MTRSQTAASDRSGTASRRSDHTDAGAPRDRVKRAASAVIGGVLVARGLRRRSLRGAVTALAGGWLLSGAVGGAPRVREALRSQAGSTERRGGRLSEDDTAASRSVTVGRPAEELHEMWRDPDQVARIADRFADVRPRGRDGLRWTVDGPRGREISWETRVVEEEPGEFIRWETPGDAMLPCEGSVRFRPASGGRGTVVTLSVSFDPPGGALGSAALNRLGVVPETLVGGMLDRFKSLAETGEVPTLDRNPSGRGRGDLL